MLPLSTLILGWPLTAIIVVGNGLVIYLIITRPSLRTTTNWFVLSLAVANFGFGAFYFPRYSSCSISPHSQSCVTHALMIAFSIGYFFAYASVTSLCVLTLDRYLAIVKPLRYVTFLTKKRVALLIFASWSVAFLVLVFCLSSYLTEPLYTRDLVKRIFWLCIGCLQISTCGFLLFTTARVFLIVQGITRQNAVVVAQLNFNHRIQHRARETASAKILGIVVAAFVICYLLDAINTFLHFGLMLPQNKFLDEVLLPLLKLMNCAINPVAYAFYKREIRRELKRLLCRRSRRVAPKVTFGKNKVEGDGCISTRFFEQSGFGVNTN